MSKLNISIINKLFILILLIPFGSCRKINEYNQPPELESLQQGLKTSVAIGYCVSIAYSAFSGKELPGNVVFDKNSGLIYIKIDRDYPLPFNSNIGDIVIACHSDSSGGVMSVLFANIDILGGKVKLYGLHIVPFMKRFGEQSITAVFVRQNIIIGAGSDTILNIGDITDFAFNTAMENLNTEKPTDEFVAVKQNFWFITINQKNTYPDVYDDVYTISGGGQIAEVAGTSGGMLYHAMIDAKVDYSACTANPIDGSAFSQNFKAGEAPIIDMGNFFLSFHNNCDGKAHVDFSSGKYLGSNGKNISLNVN